MNILDFLTNGQASQLGTDGDGAQRLVANLMMQRSEWMKSLLDYSRNVDADCGYPTGYIDARIYWELYQREPIATRTVEVYPKESWQVQPQIYEDEDASTKTQFEEAWDSLGKQLRGEQSFYQEEEASVVFDFLCDADIKCGIGHYAAILLGFDDGAPLDQPIDLIDAGKPAKASSSSSSGAAHRLLFMQVYPETAVRIDSLEADMQSPRYGLPTQYDISMMDPLEFSSLGLGTSLPTNRANVHWTRVVHISEYGVLHTPRQRPVLNRLLDLRKLYGGSAEMYWRGAFPGYAIKTQPQLGADVDINKEDVKQQLTDYSNALQRFLVLMGMDITALAPQVSDPSSQIDKQIEAICIQLGIPKRIFMGSERGELASTQDDAAWNDRLKQRQLGVITPRIIIPFVDRLIATRVLPRPAKGYRVSWPDLTSKSDEEKAGIATQRTQAIAAYVAGQLETTLAPMDFWTRILGFTEDESQSIIDNAEEVKAQKEKEQAAKDAEAAKVQAEAQAKIDAAAKTAADATGTEQTATAPGSPTSPKEPFGGKGSQSSTSAPPNASGGQPGGSTVGGDGKTPVAHAFDPSQPRDASGRWAITGGGFARKVSLEGVHDSDVVGRIHSTLTDLSEQYGLKLDSVTTNQMAKDIFDNASAARMSTFTFSGGGQPTILSHNLELDSNVWQSKESLKAYRSSLPDGYLADSSVAGMIRHEYAHGLEKEHPEASALIRDVYAGYRGNPTVSTYSAHDHKEMLAEAFSHYHRQGSLEGTGLERLGPLFDSWKVSGSSPPVAHAFDPSQLLDDLDTNAKAALSGGQWVTIEGRHVYLKGGKIVAGPPDLKGETIGAAQVKASSHDSAATTPSKESASKAESKKSGPAATVTATHLKSMEPDLNSVKDGTRREKIGKAIKGYYDGDFTEMNTALREGRADKSKLKDSIADFRSAFHEVGHELQKDVTVYRVVKKMPFNVSSLGAEFHDKGFVSTTADKSVANGLGSGGDTSERRIFSIRVPKGMKVIAGMGGRDTSKEVTLPDGLRFKVVSVGKKTLLGQHIGLEVTHG